MLFLDLDGCLVDSASAILLCLDEALQSFEQPPLEPEEASGVIGPPIGTSAARILSSRGVRDIDAATLVRCFRAIYALKGPALTPSHPGIPEALADLATHDRLVVVTSKAQQLAVPIVQASGIARYLDDVFGPGIDDIDEPKYVTLRRAMEASGVNSGIVIGDREHDVFAAHHENLAAIGVTWGAGSLEELQAAGADAIVHSPAELCSTVARVRFAREAS